MAYQQKPGDISVFKAKDKRSDRAPDWTGSLIVPEGVRPGDKLDVALWTKNDGFLAGSIKPAREQQRQEGVRVQNESRRPDLVPGYDFDPDDRPF